MYHDNMTFKMGCCMGGWGGKYTHYRITCTAPEPPKKCHCPVSWRRSWEPPWCRGRHLGWKQRTGEMTTGSWLLCCFICCVTTNIVSYVIACVRKLFSVGRIGNQGPAKFSNLFGIDLVISKNISIVCSNVYFEFVYLMKYFVSHSQNFYTKYHWKLFFKILRAPSATITTTFSIKIQLRSESRYS